MNIRHGLPIDGLEVEDRAKSPRKRRLARSNAPDNHDPFDPFDPVILVEPQRS